MRLQSRTSCGALSPLCAVTGGHLRIITKREGGQGPLYPLTALLAVHFVVKTQTPMRKEMRGSGQYAPKPPKPPCVNFTTNAGKPLPPKQWVSPVVAPMSLPRAIRFRKACKTQPSKRTGLQTPTNAFILDQLCMIKAKRDTWGISTIFPNLHPLVKSVCMRGRGHLPLYPRPFHPPYAVVSPSTVLPRVKDGVPLSFCSGKKKRDESPFDFSASPPNEPKWCQRNNNRGLSGLFAAHYSFTAASPTLHHAVR